MTTPIDITQAILTALATGDKSRGELLDLTGLKSYRELEPYLKTLIQQQKVEFYFDEHQKFRKRPLWANFTQTAK